jgi:glycosyltransferase involved in cell wall biosynthesis
MGHAGMRIGVVADSVLPEAGGVFAFVSAVADAIRECRCDHEFVIWEPSVERHTKWWKKAVKSGANLVGAHRLLRSTARRIRSFAPAEISPIERFIQESDIDLMWFLSQSNAPVSVPYITTVWDLQHRRQPYFPEVSTTGWTWEDRERAFATNLPRASRIITGTQTGKSEIVAFYRVSPENVIVIPMPVAVAEHRTDGGGHINVREKYGLKRDFIFYPAQFWPHKNHVNLLLALDFLKGCSGVELDLVLTGSDKGNLNHVSHTVAALGLTSQALVLGFVPKADLYELYREAVSLTFPSFFGPDNIPPLEAFALGCPVLAAAVPGSEEQLGNAALFFDPADPTDIARAIMNVHRNHKLRAELVRRGKEIASARSPEAYVEQICHILDDLAPIRRCWGQHFVELSSLPSSGTVTANVRDSVLCHRLGPTCVAAGATLYRR